MEFSENNDLFNCNRRDFMKVAGLGAAAMAIPGLGMIKNTNAATGSSINHEIIETDILVIGAGIAGVFAAVKSKEQGMDVTVVDKGTVGRSGLSPFFATYSYFDPKTSGTRAECFRRVGEVSGYLARLDYTDHFINHSLDMYNENLKWGIRKDPSGSRCVIWRDKVKNAGVRMIERTMITEFIMVDGKVAGAVGFPMEEDKAIVIKAKAVISCAGSGAFKTPGWPVSPLTHDSDAMAYRVGAEISGKEFVDPHSTKENNPAVSYPSKFGAWNTHAYSPTRPAGRAGIGPSMQAHNPDNVPLEGGSGRSRGNAEKSGQEARSSSGNTTVGGSAAGSAPHHCEGIFPADNRCSSNIPGLFACGDSLCTFGAIYSHGSGSSASTGAVHGLIAAEAAAEHAREVDALKVPDSQIASIKQYIFEPRFRDNGYSASWVTQVLQGYMVPYYVLYVKKQDRLEANITNIEFLRDHFAPNLMAKDTHDLRRVHELRHMILNAEMKLRASLMRTESRGAHYREDYREKDDKNWLAWIIITRDGDKMKLTKRPIPDEWRPENLAKL